MYVVAFVMSEELSGCYELLSTIIAILVKFMFVNLASLSAASES